MVKGMESFRDKFAGYEDCYTVIGGAACDVLMTENSTGFRATKDIDMIILLEDRYKEFASIFWEYIKEGGYKCGWKNSEDAHFYRFTDPKAGYPIMIELFSRMPDYHLEVEQGIIPIHIDDDISSLSAILLNDDFYQFMLAGRITVSGISVLRSEYLIPFKMYAWLDLKKRKAAGEHVNERDLKKHKYDVFRLLQIVVEETTVDTEGIVAEAVEEFMKEIQGEVIPLAQLGIELEAGTAIENLKAIYKLM